MKTSKSFLGLIMIGILLLGMATFMPQQKAQAKTCYDQAKQPVPCPKSDYLQTQQAAKQATNSISFTNTPVPPTETPIPSSTSTSIPTNTSIPTSAAFVISQSACPSPVPVVANVPTPTQPSGGSPFLPWLFGGVGMILGGLIGLLFSGRFGKRSVNGDGIIGPEHGWNGPITTPGELVPAVDKWQKGDGIVGPDRGWNGPITTSGELVPAVDKWQKGDGIGDRSVNGDGVVGLLDSTFHKGINESGFTDELHSINEKGFTDELHSMNQKGFTDELNSAMGDGSVHPSTGEGGITDGGSIQGNNPTNGTGGGS